MSFSNFNPETKSFYNKEGLAQWENGQPLYKTVALRGSEILDFVLTLENEVLGHLVYVTPSEEGGETIVSYPSFIEPIHISYEPHNCYCHFFYGDIDFNSPPKRQIIECDEDYVAYLFSVLSSYVCQTF